MVRSSYNSLYVRTTKRMKTYVLCKMGYTSFPQGKLGAAGEK